MNLKVQTLNLTDGSAVEGIDHHENFARISFGQPHYQINFIPNKFLFFICAVRGVLIKRLS